MTDSEKTFYTAGLMDLTSYRLERTALGAEWDAVVKASPQGTLFCRSAFLAPLGCRLGLWYCRKNAEHKAAVLVVESEDGESCLLHELVIYGGILFAPDPPAQNRAQIHSEQFRVTSFVVSELARLYKSVQLATHPSFTDLRPFLWHNYGEEGPKFRLDLRYTSYLSLAPANLADGLDDNPVYRSANKSRRQEIRYGMKAGVSTVSQYDPELFLDFYQETFRRQGLPVPGDVARDMARLLPGLHEAGAIRMFVARTAAGDPGSIAIFGLDEKRAYYLFGANSPNLRDAYTGTMVLWDAFRVLAQEDGATEVDLEGVNSPRRGYFKLSFGGTLTPYHHLFL